jgi:hypothetical protein
MEVGWINRHPTVLWYKPVRRRYCLGYNIWFILKNKFNFSKFLDSLVYLWHLC